MNLVSVLVLIELDYSIHWKDKRKKRSDITDDSIEYALRTSPKIKDRYWNDAWNAFSRIPPSGRLLKVVYKTKGKTIKIITAYWLEG